MAQKLRFGILTPQNVSWPLLVERWQYLEALGFDSVWLADHFVSPAQPNGPYFEAWTALAGLAARTTRVRLGTLVTSIAFRNPAVFAKQVLTVDHISQGRLELGLGAGYSPQGLDHTMTGVENWPLSERLQRFREVVEIVDQMLRHEVTTYQGRYYQVHQASMHPAPVQHPRPPLTLATQGPKMLKLVAEYADSWNVGDAAGLSVREAIEDIRGRSEILEDHCAAVGRNPHEISRSILHWGRPTADSPWGSISAFEDFVGRYWEIGVSEFIFLYPPVGGSPPAIFERVATEVIPTLRTTRGGLKTGG
jgi:alkanesulfonate monooxygenase SsuD/methylene tetrahydromethanopterin reductase-like flavin-dependent oxidoreductase (luciferase family)